MKHGKALVLWCSNVQIMWATSDASNEFRPRAVSTDDVFIALFICPAFTPPLIFGPPVY